MLHCVGTWFMTLHFFYCIPFLGDFLLTNLNDTARFLQAIGKFYSAFGIHLKGQTQRKATIQEAREDTLKLELFLDEVGHFIREKMDKQTKLNGPEGMVSDKTVQYIGLISKSLLFLQEEMESTSNVNLRSFLTGQVEHFHSITHLKFDTPTMAQHAREFYETVQSKSRSKEYAIGLPSTTPIVNTTIQYQTTPYSCQNSQSSKSQRQFKLRTQNDVLCLIGEKHMANVSSKETCAVTQRRI